MADSNENIPSAADIANLQTKLQKAELELKIYKNAFFHANQQLAIEYSKDSSSTEKVATPNVDIKGGLNPLRYLPKELWSFLFDCYLESWNDRKNCYDTCQLFHDLLEDSKNCWLFEAIFPVLKPYLKRKRVLKLREVCKTWRHVIDNSITGYNVINFPFNRDKMERLNKKLEKMQIHPSNPFIGGQVDLVHDPYHGDEYNNYHPMIDSDGTFGRGFVEFVHLYLPGLSQYITSLNLVLTDDVHFGQLELTQIVLCCLNHCKNLKEFCIKGGNNWDSEEYDVFSESEIEKLIPADFTVGQFLTSLTIKCARGLDKFQVPILWRCSKQLKCFETDILTKMHTSLDWSCLESLTYCQNDGSTKQENLIELVSSIKTSKLAKLVIGNNWNMSLVDLLRLINNFPKLEHISIVIFPDSALAKSCLNQVAEIPDYLTPQRALETMKIRCFTEESQERLDFTFLICFPFVKYLELTQSWENEGDVTTRDCKYGDKLSGQWVELEQLYKLDIWKWMPFLESLTLGKPHGQKIIFTRRGYNAYIKTVSIS